MTVTPVESRGDLAEFIELPYRINASYPAWCPPFYRDVRHRLNPRKNSFFAHSDVSLFLVRSGNSTVGRFAAIIDYSYDEIYGNGDLLFGWLDFHDSSFTADAIIGYLKRYAGEHGRKRIVGPLSFNINEEAGLLVDGFDIPQVIMTPWNPPWYGPRLEESGLVKLQDLLAYGWNTSQGIPDRLNRIADRVLERPDVESGILQLDELPGLLPHLRRIYNEAFAATWGHVPLSSEEFAAMAEDLRKTGDPGMVVILRQNGEPIAFGLTMPDWNKALRKARGRLTPGSMVRILAAAKRIDSARFIVLAVRPDCRGRGLETVIIRRTMELFLERGYEYGELSMVLESNMPMRRILESVIDTRISRRFRIYTGDAA